MAPTGTSPGTNTILVHPMPRVLLVTFDYPPQAGGVARYYHSLVTALRGSCAVLTDVVGQPEQNVQRQKLTWGAWPRWLPLLWRVPRTARTLNAEVVAAGELLPTGTALWLWRMLGGLPYVVFLHGFDVALSQRSWWKRWLARRILAAARLVVVNSSFTGSLAAAAGALPGRTVVTYPTSRLPQPTLPAAELRQRYGLDVAIVLLSVARLVHRKGIDDILAVLPELQSSFPNLAYVVVGDGPERSNLEQLAQKLKVRVQFIGAVPDGELAAWYNLCDVFALTPKEDAVDVEGFGIVYLEAQAAGKPVVATRVGGVPEAVGGAGLLVATSAELIAGLRTLLSDTALRQSLGEQGRAHAQGFTVERQAAILERHLYAD